MTRLRHTVIVVLNNVIQHTHGGFHGAVEFFFIQFAVFVDVLNHVDRTEVTNRDFLIRGVQGNFSTQV